MDNVTEPATAAVFTTQDTGDSHDVLLASHRLYIAALWIYKTGHLTVFVLGLFGNIMILVIQRRLRHQMKDSVMSVFITALAISDVLMIMSTLCGSSLYEYGVNLYSLHGIFCRGLFFLLFVFGTTSSWFLVSMTMHRAFSIVSPHRAGILCSGTRAKWCVLVITVLAMANNSHILYGRSILISDNGEEHCGYVSAGYYAFLSKVWYWVDMAVSSVVPFFLLILSNSAIVYRVRQSLREARLKLAAGTADQLQARQAKASSMNVTLICASTAFLVLTLPLLIAILVRNFKSSDAVPSVDEEAADYFFAAFADMLWVANNGVNFYIYSLTGNKYRAELARMCGCGSRSDRAPTSTITTVSRSE